MKIGKRSADSGGKRRSDRFIIKNNNLGVVKTKKAALTLSAR